MGNEHKCWDGPPLEAWDCFTPQQIAAVMRKLHEPWCIVGGWALDLFLGQATRPHEDIEIAVPRTHFERVRKQLETTFVLHAVGDGEVRRLTSGAPYPEDKHQCWLLDERAGKWRVDIMQEPGDASLWAYRRNGSVRAPRWSVTKYSRDGIPYLAPECVLLFKEARRPKDVADFEMTLPELSAPSRAWLLAALQLAHPASPWIERLHASATQ